MSKPRIGRRQWSEADPGRYAVLCTIDGTFVLVTGPGMGMEFDTIAEAADEARARIAASAETPC